MRKRNFALLSMALVPLVVVLPGAGAGPLPGTNNPWLDRAPLNIAHQGGEIEAPSNTMYAFKEAVAKGADVIELDVHATADRQVVVIHDTTVDRTTNGSGRIDAMTLAEVQALDAAHWFVPNVGTTHARPAGDYVYRGVALGATAPPAGYSASDFEIPTLEAVLQEFPDVLINIEIKRTAPDTLPYESLLAGLLKKHGREDNVIVVSFFDAAMEAFKAFAPDVHTATATGETALFFASAEQGLPGAPNPRYQALQVPIVFEGVTVIDQDFVTDANANGLAVHVWTINSEPEMHYLLDLGVQGIMTDRPSLLEQVIASRG